MRWIQSGRSGCTNLSAAKKKKPGWWPEVKTGCIADQGGVQRKVIWHQ